MRPDGPLPTAPPAPARRLGAALLAFALALGLAGPAAALDLDEARRKGLVGEQLDGYVGIVVSDPSPEVRALVAEVNERRRANYERIARQNGTAVEAVAALAGAKLIERLPPGHYVRADGGGWYVKK